MKHPKQTRVRGVVPAPDHSPQRRVFRDLMTLIPTVNAVLLIVQSALAQPPLDAAFPGWIYLAANAAVVIGSALARTIQALAKNTVLTRGMGWDTEMLSPPQNDGSDQ